MDTEFECTSCSQVCQQAAFAVVLPNSLAFPRIFIFCSRECYYPPFFKALEGLTLEQRSPLGKITVYLWEDGIPDSAIFSNAETMLGYFKLGEKFMLEKAEEADRVGYKEELADPCLAGFTRRIKRMLISTRPESSYPINFKALYFLLRGPIPEGPEKL